MSSSEVLKGFDEVIAHLYKNNRTPNLLLGNGFSMAFDPSIFSYNALHAFVDQVEDKVLSIDNVDSIADYQVMLTELYPDSAEDINVFIKAMLKVMKHLEVNLNDYIIRQDFLWGDELLFCHHL